MHLVCVFLWNSFLAVRVSVRVYFLLCWSVVEVGLMVPRRIGDVSCGENRTVWQTQRRHEEGSSHPCLLRQWSHQRLIQLFSNNYSVFILEKFTNRALGMQKAVILLSAHIGGRRSFHRDGPVPVQPVRRHYCCDFALVFAALAWGSKRLCSLTEGRGSVRGVGQEGRPDGGRLDWVWQGNALKRGLLDDLFSNTSP